MKNIYSILVFVAFTFIVGCQSASNNSKGEKYGGTLKLNAVDIPSVIFPGQALKSSEQLVLNQVYVGLVKYHPRTLEIIPSLANRWLVESDGTLYTFYLNSQAYFHNDACFEKDKGRKITAHDVKYSIEQICRSHVNSGHMLSKQVLNIEGSNSLLDSVKLTDSIEISGIEVFNDTTLILNLTKPDEMLIHFLAGTNSMVFPKEAYEKYQTKSRVGSGAFVLQESSGASSTIELLANDNYFGQSRTNEQLPFLDTLSISFITSAPKELFLFEQGKIQLILGLSKNYVTNFLDENIDSFQSNPPYYLMKTTFDNKGVMRYSLLRSNIQGLEINSQGYFDFSEVYIKDIVEQTIQLN